MSTGLVTDEKLLQQLTTNHKDNSILLWQNKDEGPVITHVIEGSDTKEILENILEILPNPNILDDQQFRVRSF